MKADGSTYYYSDYNFAGQRVYHDGNWACCAGTLPQVATDYGINSYLQEPGAVWVNLYIPSVLRWNVGANQIQMEQKGTYPVSDAVEFRMTAARPEMFALNLRIPAWAEGCADFGEWTGGAARGDEGVCGGSADVEERRRGGVGVAVEAEAGGD